MASFGAFCAIVLLLCISAASADERRVALVIGNGAYTGTGSLANTVNEAMGASLEKLGFAVTVVKNVGREGAIAAIAAFNRELPGAEI